MNAPINPATLTDQNTLTFVQRQASHIESQVYRKKYPDITYATHVPVDTSANEYAPTVTYYQSNGRGVAKWYNGKGTDIPFADAEMNQFETQVWAAATGYSFDILAIGQARQLNRNLPSEGAFYARRAYEEFVEDLAYVGDPQKGLTGFLNSASVTTVGASNGTGGTADWDNKTADEVLLDVNNAIIGQHIDTNTVEMADTVLLPTDKLLSISSKRIPDSDKTILEYLLKNNAYTAKTRQPLKIDGLRQLSGAGVADTDRMIAYRNDSEVVKMHIPMPLRFMPTQLIMLEYKTPALFRVGGVDIRRPGAVRYVDGI